VALAADMLFASRIRGAANAAGVPVRVVSSAAAALDAVRAGARRLLLDLDSRAADPIGLIEQLRADSATAGVEVIAFVSHVREDRIAAARAAGATRVLARSAFVRELPRLLSNPDASLG
jgi:CheY-like chemotaxis protein